MDLEQVAARARTELEHTILPFWLDRGIDHQHGGFHTCFDNRGRERLGTDKFTWSQGRFVWLLARAADLADRGLLSADPTTLLRHARDGARFLLDHAVGADGTCVFRLAADGSRLSATAPGRSVYADCFVAMGLAELARVSGERNWLTAATPVLDRSRDDIVAGNAPTPPYEVPAGYQAFGPRMILLNTLVVQVAAMRQLNPLARPGEETRHLAQALEDVMEHRSEDGMFLEFVAPPADPQASASLAARHRVPGHAIEGLWVALEAMELTGDHHRLDDVLGSLPALCRLGWDTEHGGLLRYTDATGPVRPRGRTVGTVYERLVLDTWDTKLWWVHTEASYTAALMATRYRSAEAAQWFARIWEYTLQTFPGRADGEEWIQIRDRRGRPRDEVVALPVKDPFHIARNLMQIVELTSRD